MTGINTIFNDNNVYNPRWYTTGNSTVKHTVRVEISMCVHANYRFGSQIRRPTQTLKCEHLHMRRIFICVTSLL